MSKIDLKYVDFYLDGRDEDAEVTIDLGEIAKQVLAGTDVQVAIRTAASNALAPLVNSEKRAWIAKAQKDGALDGLSGDVAWEHFHNGRVDGLAYVIDDDALEAIELATEDDDEGEDDGVEGEEPADEQEHDEGEEGEDGDKNDSDDDPEEP